MRSVDKARASYCARYTGCRYGDAVSYDLTLCTSTLGIEGALELILKAAEHI
jgi:hypothetical protein